MLAILTEGGSGISVTEVYRNHEISSPTNYWWKSGCAGMSLHGAKQAKQMES